MSMSETSVGIIRREERLKLEVFRDDEAARRGRGRNSRATSEDSGRRAWPLRHGRKRRANDTDHAPRVHRKEASVGADRRPIASLSPAALE